MNKIDAIERKFLKKTFPLFEIGDTVDVHVRVIEGEKERTQIFTGTVIARKGRGMAENFTVRRIVQGEGVERIFPVQSPRVVDVKVRKKGQVNRAKLYYLRGRKGKATKIREKLQESGATPPAPPEQTQAKSSPPPPQA